jgi:hypothetical protein
MGREDEIIPRFATSHKMPPSKSPMVPRCSGTFRQKLDTAWNTPRTAPNGREPNPSLSRDLFDMEVRWLSLARCYQFVNQLIASSENAQQRGAVSERLKHLRIRIDQADANRPTRS